MAGSFGAVGNSILVDAKKKLREGGKGKLTMREKVMLLMEDGDWRTGAELAKVSWRFGGYLHDLKASGVEWEKRPLKIKGKRLFEYRLVAKD